MLLKLPSAEQLLFVANIIADRLFFRQQYDATVKSILIVKWDEIGDMATATHVFRLMRESYPNAEITVLCKPFVSALIACDPHIDVIINTIDGYKKKYDMLVELRGTWSTLIRSLMHKARFRVSRAEVRAQNKGRQLHEYATNTAIVQPLLKAPVQQASPELYFSEKDEIDVVGFLQSKQIGKFAVFHVGARRVLRQWPLERFALVAEYLHKQYGYAIIFAGTAEDEAQIVQVQKGLIFETYLFTQGYSLSQFACLCSKAVFYVGNESGPLQIAAIFKVPLIGLFGPGVPNVFYPQYEKSRVLHHVLSCNPCNQIDCVEPQNPCINRIAAADVLNAVSELCD